MKRTWRAGRVILAVLLLSLVGVASYVWPRGPRWQVEREAHSGFSLKPLCFDLAKNLLFAFRVQNTEDQFELLGFDLTTGAKRVSRQLIFSKPERSVQTTWHAILSADCSTLVCYNGVSFFQIFDVRQQCQRLFSFNWDKIDSIESIGLSFHGELLAIHKNFEVQVWDCQTGKIKRRLSMPSGTVSKIHEGRMLLHPEYLKFSKDGRYLAVGGDEDAIAVFDLNAEQAIAVCPNSRIPLFLSDSRTLIAIPPIYNSKKGCWYQLDGSKVTPSQITMTLDPEKEYLLGASDARLLTGTWDHSDRWSFPEWIPESLRDKLEVAMGRKKYRLQIRSCNSTTGQVCDEFVLQVSDREVATVSPDGLLLALKNYDHISLWDIPPRRSLTCWLVCISFALIALWIGYPRRQKAQSLGVTP